MEEPRCRVCKAVAKRELREGELGQQERYIAPCGEMVSWYYGNTTALRMFTRWASGCTAEPEEGKP